MQDLLEQEREELRASGVFIPSGQVARTAIWARQMGPTDELIDMLADEYFRARVHLIPADESPLGARVSALVCRSLARRAVMHARKRTGEWEAYADELTAAMPTFADTFDQRWAEMVESLPIASARQVIHASTNPMGAHRWSLHLENLGTHLIRMCSHDSGARPDVWVKDKRTHVARRDVVAYRGEARFTLPQPCRYGASGLIPAMEVNPETGVLEYLTQVSRPMETARARCGWRGHRWVTWELAPRKGGQGKRVKARKARAEIGATGKRGPASTPWAMTERNVRRATVKLADVVASIENTLRTMAEGESIAYGDTTVTVMAGSATVVDSHRGRAYPVREWARRMALETATK